MTGTVDRYVPSAWEQVLRPGDFAPVSGIYCASHFVHREPHDILVIQQEPLPLCRTCQRLVEFRLIRTLTYVQHDADFAGPVITELEWGKAA